MIRAFELMQLFFANYYLNNLENSFQPSFGSVFESSCLHHTNFSLWKYEEIIMESRLTSIVKSKKKQ